MESLLHTWWLLGAFNVSLQDYRSQLEQRCTRCKGHSRQQREKKVKAVAEAVYPVTSHLIVQFSHKSFLFCTVLLASSYPIPVQSLCKYDSSAVETFNAQLAAIGFATFPYVQPPNSTHHRVLEALQTHSSLHIRFNRHPCIALGRWKTADPQRGAQ